jgi:hypothetical protein
VGVISKVPCRAVGLLEHDFDRQDGRVEFLGYGRYVGESPSRDSGVTNQPWEPHPTIILDSGEEIHTERFWWVEEAAVREALEGQTVEVVTMSDVRRRRDDERDIGGEEVVGPPNQFPPFVE